MQIDLPACAHLDGLRVDVDGRDVTGAFAVRPNGHVQGLLADLSLGPNRVTAVLPDGRGAYLAIITNHPNGGPVFTGPAQHPYTCQPAAVDDLCNQPAEFANLYLPERRQRPRYDPENPPSDVAMTTTDEGETVPLFIVRQELGYQDRNQYKILVLFNPEMPWDAPWAPQSQWNEKVVILHGGSCEAA